MAKAGTRYEHDQIVFWAENGLIYVEDHRDGTFNAISVKDALKRAAVLAVEARRVAARVRVSAGSSGNHVAAEDRNKLLTCVENLIKACQQARTQGDPSDPKVIEDLRKQRKKNKLVFGVDLDAGGEKKLLLPSGEQANSGKKTKPQLWMP
jgi:hypothetical protein